MQDAFGINATSNEARTPLFHYYNVQAIQSIQTTRGVTNVVAGERVTFTYAITNTGFFISLTDANLRLIVNSLSGATVISGSASSSQGSISYEGSLKFLFGDLPVGAVITASFAATANAQIPLEISNQGEVNWRVFLNFIGYETYRKFANVVRIPILHQRELRLHQIPPQQFIQPGEVAKFKFSYDSSLTQNETLPINAIYITTTVPEHTFFDASASAPTLWSCSNNSPAGSVCVYSYGPITQVSHSSLITFAVRLDSSLPASVQRIAQVRRSLVMTAQTALTLTRQTI